MATSDLLARAAKGDDKFFSMKENEKKDLDSAWRTKLAKGGLERCQFYTFKNIDKLVTVLRQHKTV